MASTVDPVRRRETAHQSTNWTLDDPLPLNGKCIPPYCEGRLVPLNCASSEAYSCRMRRITLEDVLVEIGVMKCWALAIFCRIV